MGFVVTSPSSSGHLKSCCSERKRTATVVVLNRVWRSTMKFSTWLSTNRGDGGRHTLTHEEVGKLRRGLGVGLDRPR
jgi:hypothetical protein